MTGNYQSDAGGDWKDANDQKLDCTRILVIDDSEDDRLLLRRALKGAGFSILEARTGNEGLEMLPRIQADVVVLDVCMPCVDGFTICRKLRAMPQGEHLPILMLTGHNNIETVRKAYDAGATDFMTKPGAGDFHTGYQELAERVRYIVRNHQSYSATACRVSSQARLHERVLQFDHSNILAEYHSSSVDNIFICKGNPVGQPIEQLFPRDVVESYKQHLEKARGQHNVETWRYTLSEDERCYESRILSSFNQEWLALVRTV